jgi:G3E family GTPase
MTLLQLSAPSDISVLASGRRGVTLLSGFLGSGKTTLLRAELTRASAVPAVIINDFGQTTVDDVLLPTDGYRQIVLSGGCACCTRREELAEALGALLESEQRGSVPRRDHVVIETSGLSDPGPIAFTVANDPLLKHHYALTRICVTVDALTGLSSIERHEIALRQLLAADDVIITKADLAEPSQVESLLRRLHELNPSAGVSVTARGVLQYVQSPELTRIAHTKGRLVMGGAHTRGISTLELVTQKTIDWQAFSVWLSLLLHGRGPDVLRVKGVLDVQNVGSVAVNCVQHVVHEPEHLPDFVPTGTRLVFIVRDIDTKLLERSFHTFLAIH